MAQLPASVSYGKVVGRFVLAVGDNVAGDSDVDNYPDAVPAQGYVTFNAVPDYVLNNSSGTFTTIYLDTIVCPLDVNGYITDPAGQAGVWLVATDDPDNNPTGWTYTVTVTITNAPTLPKTFSIQVPGGSTTDITTLTPVPDSAGTYYLVGPPPNVTIGTVTTLATGASATASITGTSPNYTLNLGLPRGAAGSMTSTGVVATNDLSVYSDTSGSLLKSAGFGTADVARLSQTQTFTGAKTFGATLTVDTGAGYTTQVGANNVQFNRAGFNAIQAAVATGTIAIRTTNSVLGDITNVTFSQTSGIGTSSFGSNVLPSSNSSYDLGSSSLRWNLMYSNALSLYGVGGNGLTLRNASADGNLFMQFYSQGATTPGTRTAYFGFASAGSTALRLQNEITNADITLATTGTGSIQLTAATNVTGTLTATTFSGSGASLSSLNASNLSTGTVATGRLGTGTANSSTFLRGDGQWASAAPNKAVNAQTGTSYTTVLADAVQFITMNNAATSTLTIPPNSSVAYPIGTELEGATIGVGSLTLTPGSGVTINAPDGALKVTVRYGTFGLKKIATDTWIAYGRLAP